MNNPKSRTTLIYDVIQRWEVTDGEPRLMSTEKKVIEGGHNLMTVAQEWIKVNTTLCHNQTKNYLGYRKKKVGSPKYVLCLAQRGMSLQVSFPPNERVTTECKKESWFPYMVRTSVQTSEQLIELLETLFLPSSDDSNVKD